MSLDVVIVTYKSADHLEACVASLPSFARVIVVDNDSGDGSAELAESLGCELLRNPSNQGFGRAVNRAVRELVHAERFLLLNPDARIDEPDLQRLLTALDDPAVAVAGPRLRTPDGHAQRPWWEFPSPRVAWTEALGLHLLRKPDLDRTADVPFVVGACFLVRTTAFREVGGFDERYWLYGEEADLCRRLWDSGWRVRFVAEAVAEHVGGASGQSESVTVADHFMRGSDRFVLTHQGARALVSFRLANLVGSAVRVVAMSPSNPRRAVRRNIVRRLAREAVHHPTLVSKAADAVPGRCLVVCSLEAWDDVWRRNQFLVRELTDADPSLRVLFVEPAVDPLHELLKRRRLPDLRTLGRLRPVPGRPHVIRTRPVKWLPRRLGHWADRSVVRQIERAAERAEMFDPTLWVNDLGCAPLVAAQPWPVLYDITDDWLLAAGSERQVLERRQREDALFDAAGVVVVCSPELQRTKTDGAPPRLIPNAVDVDHFRTPRARPLDLPDDPTALYVGTLHDDRIDIDLLVRTARELPDVHLVLIGPDSLSVASRTRLDEFANVHRLGPRPYEDVPAYLQHATVIVIPHVVSPFTESLDPIKAYECLAVGRPTLATPVAGFRDQEPPIVVAGSQVFASRLRALIDDAPPIAPLPPCLASWRDRANAFVDALHAARTTGRKAPRRKLRVVYLDHTARLSGGELAIARLLPALADCGVDPHVILGEEGPFAEELRSIGVRTEVLPFASAARDLRRDRVAPTRLPLQSAALTAVYAFRLAKRLRGLRPDLVHTNSLKSALYGGVAGRIARVPVIWHVRDRIADDYLPHPAVVAVRAAARVLPTAIIANSQATLDTLGELRTPSAVAPSPVVFDEHRFPTERTSADTRPLTIGILGRLSPWKGQHVFLAAFAKAFPTGDTRAQLIGSAMFGEDEYETSLHSLCAQLDIADRVDFLGFRKDVFETLAGIDVLVHASTLPEPFGQVIVEGMAAGLPVIAAAAGGPMETITHGVDGILIPPDDVDALAHELQRLAADPTLRDELGRRGHERAKDYRPERVAEKVMQLYRTVGSTLRAHQIR